MRVVLAHASSDARARYARVLGALGHEVFETASASEALERTRAAAPDVAILDAQLCQNGGTGVLEALKADPEAYRTAVVLVERARLDLDVAVEALRRGVQDFIVEPVADGELAARVEAAGRTRGLQQELVEQAKRLEALLFEDALTGLANRRYILTQLNGMVSGARRHGRPLSVAVIDIDHFKRINDVHGHAAGDRVLAAVTDSLRHRLRAEDQLGRLGGEEFLALLPDADAPAAAAAAERMRSDVRGTRVEHDGHRLAVTVSIGWAAWEGETPDDLLRRADDALYAAKGAGRDRAVGAPATVQRRI